MHGLVYNFCEALIAAVFFLEEFSYTSIEHFCFMNGALQCFPAEVLFGSPPSMLIDIRHTH